MPIPSPIETAARPAPDEDVPEPDPELELELVEPVSLVCMASWRNSAKVFGPEDGVLIPITIPCSQ